MNVIDVSAKKKNVIDGCHHSCPNLSIVNRNLKLVPQGSLSVRHSRISKRTYCGSNIVSVGQRGVIFNHCPNENQ